MPGTIDEKEDVIILGEEQISADEPDEIEIDEEASDAEKARALVGASELEDPVKALLATDPTTAPQDVWFCKRLGVEFLVEGFNDDTEYDRVVKRATDMVKRKGGGRVKEVDGRRLARLVVVEGCVNPSFKQGSDSFRQLSEKFGVIDSESLVGRALLPGEIEAVAEKILQLSGFDDDLEEVAGN